jgi:hypothetical protein
MSTVVMVSHWLAKGFTMHKYSSIKKNGICHGVQADVVLPYHLDHGFRDIVEGALKAGFPFKMPGTGFEPA